MAINPYDFSDIVRAEPAPYEPPALQPASPFKEGWNTGVEGVKSSLYGAGALVAAGFGAKGLEKSALEKAKEHQDLAGESARRVEDVSDIASGFDYAKWALGTVLPSSLSFMATALVGRGAGAGLARNAASQVTKDFAKTVGAGVGGFGASTILEAGSIYPEAVESGVENPTLRTAVAAPVAGALDFAGNLIPAARLGLFGAPASQVGRVASRGWGGAAKQVGKDVLINAPIEGFTETGQSAIERGASGKSLTDPEAMSEYLNSFFPGLIGGGMTVPASAYRGYVGQPTDSTGETDASSRETSGNEAVQQVPGATGQAGAEVLPGVPRGVDATQQAEAQRVAGAAATQGQRPGVFQDPQATGQTGAAAVPVRASELGNAPSRPDQPAVGGVAVPGVSSFAPQGFGSLNEVDETKQSLTARIADLQALAEQPANKRGKGMTKQVIAKEIKALKGGIADLDAASELLPSGEGSPLEQSAPLLNTIARRDEMAARVKEIEDTLATAARFKPEFREQTPEQLAALESEAKGLKQDLGRVNKVLSLVRMPSTDPTAPKLTDNAIPAVAVNDANAPGGTATPVQAAAEARAAAAAAAEVKLSTEIAAGKAALDQRRKEVDTAYAQLNAQREAQKSRDATAATLQAAGQNADTAVTVANASGSGVQDDAEPNAMQLAMEKAGLIQPKAKPAPAEDPEKAGVMSRAREHTVWEAVKKGQFDGITDDELMSATRRGPVSVQRAALKEMGSRIEYEQFTGKPLSAGTAAPTPAPAATPTPAAAPAAAPAAKPAEKTDAKKMNPRKNPFLKWIARFGGIDSRFASDVAGERGFRANSLFPGLFKKKRMVGKNIVAGMGLDELASRAVDEKWMSPAVLEDVDGGVGAFVYMVQRALDGERITRFDQEEATFSALRAEGEMTPEEWEATGYAKLGKNLQEQVDYLLSRYDDVFGEGQSEGLREEIARQIPEGFTDDQYNEALVSAIEERFKAYRYATDLERSGKATGGTDGLGAQAGSGDNEQNYRGQDPRDSGSLSQDLIQLDIFGDQTPTPANASTAPEHKGNKGKPLDTSTVYQGAAAGAPVKRNAEGYDGVVRMEMSTADFAEITDEWAELFANPKEKVITEHRAKKEPTLTPEQAQERIDSWKAHAAAQAKNNKIDNSSKTVLSLFDYTGEWSKPWVEAGYNVITFDIQNGHDILDFSVEYFNDNWDFSDVYAILAACPCTDFASSGSKHFAGKDADGRTEASKELVFQTMRTLEYFRPKVWALENPVGRIENLTGLPKSRMTFDPNHFGSPYTKKTILWGNFDPNLPLAKVEPTEGSKMHSKYGGKSQATKNARSETPEGFAYAFFMANNYADKTPEEKLVMDYPEVSGAVKVAIRSGVSEEKIRELMEDTYGNYEYDAARDALADAVAEYTGVPIDKKAIAARIERQRKEDEAREEAEREEYANSPEGKAEDAQREAEFKALRKAPVADPAYWDVDMSEPGSYEVVDKKGKVIEQYFGSRSEAEKFIKAEKKKYDDAKKAPAQGDGRPALDLKPQTQAEVNAEHEARVKAAKAEADAKKGKPAVRPAISTGQDDMFNGNGSLFDPGVESAAENYAIAATQTGAAVTANQEGAASPATAPKIYLDNPGGQWLADKQADNAAKGRGSFGEPARFGDVTGSYDKPVMVPVEILAKLPGLRGEQSNVRSDSLEWLKDYMERTGKLPPFSDKSGKEYVPFIMVNQDGEAWVNEGNHRIMAAAALGWKSMPVEIRYFSGGERAQSALSPANIQKYHAEQVDGRPKIQTDTPAFRAWFGDSKVVDADGNPLRVYHGSDKDFEIFNTNRSDGAGEIGAFFTTDSGDAESYAYSRTDSAVIYPVFLSIKNPYVVTASQWLNGDGLSPLEAKKAGHDGYLVKDMQTDPDSGSVADVWISFRPTQIKSATGNNGEFDPNNDSILRQPYQTDLFGAPLPAPDMANAQAAARLKNVVPAGDIPGSVFATVVEPVQSGVMRSGFDKIETGAQAAHALASIRKSAGERFVILITDKDKKPISVVHIGAGSVAKVTVSEEMMAKAVYQTRGSANVWYAHNHPGGESTPSVPDQNMTRQISRIFGAGTGINVEGHVVIGGGKYAELNASGNLVKNYGEIPAAARTFSIPITERRVVTGKKMVNDQITTPNLSLAIIPKVIGERTGVVFLDTQQRPLGYLHMPISEMMKLRNGGDDSATRKFYAAVGRSNAAHIIAYTPKTTSEEQAQAAFKNIGSAAYAANIGMLDGVHGDVSFAGRKLPLTNVFKDTFYSVDAVLQPYDNRSYGYKVIGQQIHSYLDRILGGSDDLTVKLFEQRAKNGPVGIYSTTPTKDVLAIAYNAKAPLSVAAHEGFHRIENKHLSTKERMIIRRALARGTGMFNNVLDLAKKYDAENSTGIADEILGNPKEASAYAFQFWSDGQLDGGMLQAIFQKIAQLLEKIRNYIDGYGFKSIEDIFEAVDRGAYASSDASVFIQDVSALSAQLDATANDLWNSMPGNRPELPAPKWYSAVERALENTKQNSAPAAQWKATIKSMPGVKPSEIAAIGLNEWLDLQKGKVARQQILDFVRQNGVKVEEVVLGNAKPGATMSQEEVREALAAQKKEYERMSAVSLAVLYEDRFNAAPEEAANLASQQRRGVINELLMSDRDNLINVGYMNDGEQPKYERYQLPGGKNYRERLYTLPEKKFGDIEALPPGYSIVPMARPRFVDGVLQGQVGARFALEGPDSVGTRLNAMTEEDARQEAINMLRDNGALARIDKRSFQSSHFDQKNIVAHERVNDREVGIEEIKDSFPDAYAKLKAEGRTTVRIRFTEEFQSDWAQKGKNEGFRDDSVISGLKEAHNAAKAERATAAKELDRLLEKTPTMQSVSVAEVMEAAENRGISTGGGLTQAQVDSLYAAADKYAVAIDNAISAATELMNAQRASIPAAPFVSSRKYGIFKEGVEMEFTKGGDIAGPGEGTTRRFKTMEEAKGAAKKYSADAKDLGAQADTQAWTSLALKSAIRDAAEGDYDFIAWTNGAQQVERYTAALRRAVDSIEWTKTEKGIQIVGYKGKGDRKGSEAWQGFRDDIAKYDRQINELLDNNLRYDREEYSERLANLKSERAYALEELAKLEGKRRDKVVDTTESESALSDAIGKAMADRIINDPAQSGTIEGDGIMIDDTGMAGYYDRILPNVANDVLKSLGGGKVGEVSITTGKGKPTDYEDFAAWNAAPGSTTGKQMGFYINKTMKERVLDEGVPLFSKAALKDDGRAAPPPMASTPKFREWFGDSKVVDADGNPLVVYHGSEHDITEFRSPYDRGTSDQTGIYFTTSPDLAATYGSKGDFYTGGKGSFYGNPKGATYPVYLSIKNPFDLTDQRVVEGWKGALLKAINPRLAAAIEKKNAVRGDLAESIIFPQERARLIAAGYDGVYGGGGVWIAFNPTQIKSATGNNGEFDPNNPSILYSRAALEKGSLQDMARRVEAGELPLTQLMNALANHVDKADVPTATYAKVFGAAKESFKGGLARAYLSNFSTGNNISKRSVGYKNVFDVVSAYNQAKNRLIAENLDVGLSKWKPWESKGEDAKAAGKFLLDRTFNNWKVGDADYQLAYARLSSDQKAMVEQANKTIPTMLMAEFEADKQGYRAVLDDEAYAQWEQDRATQIQKMIEDGYVPERRYGNFGVNVSIMAPDVNGVPKKMLLRYDLFENQAQQELFYRQLVGTEKEPGPLAGLGLTIEKGTKFKPEFDASLSFKQFLDLANRYGITLSQAEREKIGKAMITADSTRRSRIFQRKNIPGYSEDATRVLAEFVTNISNKVAYADYGNAIQDALNGAKVDIGWDAAVKKPTMVIDEKARVWSEDGENAGYYHSEAQKMVNTVVGPQDEANWTRVAKMAATMGFLGGSMAFVPVQLTSIPMNVVPYLFKSTTYTNASARAYSALSKTMANSKTLFDLAKLTDKTNKVDWVDNTPGLRDAMIRAGEDGTTMDTELYQLMGMTRGGMMSKSRTAQKAVDAWMFPFRWSEKVNRITTFAAAYQVGLDNKMTGDALYKFAQQAVFDTQIRYDMANRPAVMRNPIYALLLTFKTYPIAMTELLVNLHKEKPAAAVAMLGSLAIMAGVNGMPFREDIMDLVDTLAQRFFGQPFNSQRWLRNHMKNASEALTGADYSGLMLNGIVNSMMDLNLQSRVGMHNLIPGSRVAAVDVDWTREATEMLGPVGTQVINAVKGGGQLLKGEFVDAIRTGGPTAAQNVVKAMQQYQNGYAVDGKGQKLVDVSGWNVFWQALGFSNASLSNAYDLDRIDKQTMAFYNIARNDFIKDITEAVRNNEPDKIRDTVDLIAKWNVANPDMPIVLNPAAMRRHIQQAGMPINERTLLRLPQKLRAGSFSAEQTTEAQ